MSDLNISAGDGLTIHTRGGQLPGTILRVSTSRRCLWYRPDVTSDGNPVPADWPHVARALKQPDGVYCDDAQMHRIEVGIRRPFRVPVNGRFAPDANDLTSLETALERIEPSLLKTRWYPMTYMLIPSILQSADELITATLAFRPTNDDEQLRITAVRTRITALRQGFRRVHPMEMTERMRLDDAYRATTFVAELPTGTCDLRVGRRHPSLDAVLATKGTSQWAYLTAWNPHSKEMPAEMNAAAQSRLEAELDRPGQPFFPGTSRPDDGTSGEEGVLAFIDRETAIVLGQRFHQNAIVVGVVDGAAELVWLR